MNKKELLNKNGWFIECESPFEIRHDESGSFATLRAADAVVDNLKADAVVDNLKADAVVDILKYEEKFSDLCLLKDSYLKNFIDKDTYIAKSIEILEK